jgi:hypothetical protein
MYYVAFMLYGSPGETEPAPAPRERGATNWQSDLEMAFCQVRSVGSARLPGVLVGAEDLRDVFQAPRSVAFHIIAIHLEVSMARASRKTALNVTAENVGSALGHLAARLDRWKADRASIAADIQQLLKSAQGLLDDVGESATVGFKTGRGKGGRPKGYKMSAATKAKLRAAWKRRKAEATRTGG